MVWCSAAISATVSLAWKRHSRVVPVSRLSSLAWVTPPILPPPMWYSAAVTLYRVPSRRSATPGRSSAAVIMAGSSGGSLSTLGPRRPRGKRLPRRGDSGNPRPTRAARRPRMTDAKPTWRFPARLLDRERRRAVRARRLLRHVHRAAHLPAPGGRARRRAGRLRGAALFGGAHLPVPVLHRRDRRPARLPHVADPGVRAARPRATRSLGLLHTLLRRCSPALLLVVLGGSFVKPVITGTASRVVQRGQPGARVQHLLHDGQHRLVHRQDHRGADPHRAGRRTTCRSSRPRRRSWRC